MDRLLSAFEIGALEHKRKTKKQAHVTRVRTSTSFTKSVCACDYILDSVAVHVRPIFFSICLTVCGGIRYLSAAPPELSKLFNLSLLKHDNEDACAQAVNGEYTKVSMYHEHNQM